MRILHVIPTLQRAGAEMFLKNLACLMRKNNVLVTVLFFSSADPVFLKQLENSGVELVQMQLKSDAKIYSISNFWKLYQFLRKKTFDVVHAHLTPAQFFLCIIDYFFLKLTLVTTEHSVNNKRRKRFFKFFDFLFYRRCKKIVCVSEAVRDSFVKWLPSLSDKCAVIYNGICLDEFKYIPQAAPKNDRLVLICLGRLIPVKNHAVCIRAIAELPNFELWLIGSGELQESLQKLSNDLRISDRVKFLGGCDNIPELLSQADIYVQPSLWEGFSIALIEAMASSLPIVVSDVLPLQEAGGDCAYYFAPHNHTHLIQILQTLAENPELRATMGQKARKRAEQFSIQNSFLEHMKLYQDVNQ